MIFMIILNFMYANAFIMNRSSFNKIQNNYKIYSNKKNITNDLIDNNNVLNISVKLINNIFENYVKEDEKIFNTTFDSNLMNIPNKIELKEENVFINYSISQNEINDIYKDVKLFNQDYDLFVIYLYLKKNKLLKILKNNKKTEIEKLKIIDHNKKLLDNSKFDDSLINGGLMKDWNILF